MDKYIGLLMSDNFYRLSASFTIEQIEIIYNGDMVYKAMCGAPQNEVNKHFARIWLVWKELIQKKSYRKAKIVEKILYQINEYVVDEYDKNLNESYIDFDRFKK